MKALALILALVPAAAAAGPLASFTLGFDLLTPAAMTCTADAPGSVVRASRSLVGGTPLLTITGDVDAASITCAAPDGSRWFTRLPRDSRDRLAASVEGLAAWRPGATRMPLYISAADRFTEYHRFTRIDGRQAP